MTGNRGGATPPAPPAGAPGPRPAGGPAVPVVASEQVLHGHKAVDIAHNGRLYRLQVTKQGKLILTK